MSEEPTSAGDSLGRHNPNDMKMIEHATLGSLPGKGLMGDISAAERVLQRVVDWERRPSPAEGTKGWHFWGMNLGRSAEGVEGPLCFRWTGMEF